MKPLNLVHHQKAKEGEMARAATIKIFIVMKDGPHRYYLMKVERRGFDVYCIPPHLRVHYSAHESGKRHFRHEGGGNETRKAPPIILMDGEAGIPFGDGVMGESLRDLGRAAGICTAFFYIDSLGSNFQEFNRNPKQCFVIDKGLLLQSTSPIEIGVWAVPDRNKSSFEYCIPNIPADLLFKVPQVEPQIWIYARGT